MTNTRQQKPTFVKKRNMSIATLKTKYNKPNSFAVLKENVKWLIFIKTEKCQELKKHEVSV